MSWVDEAPQGVELDAPLLGEPGKRSAAAMREIIAQFDVTHSQRYAPGARGGATWCNKFVKDVLRALGVPAGFSLANDWSHWAKTAGVKLRWSPVKRPDVKLAVSMGLPVVAHYWNPKGHGHIAMLVEPVLDRHLPAYARGELFIAQAGAFNSSECPLSSGFGNHPVTFWSCL